MDHPLTRRDTKKDQKEKARGKDGKYSQKHIRNVGVFYVGKSIKGVRLLAGLLAMFSLGLFAYTD